MQTSAPCTLFLLVSFLMLSCIARETTAQPVTDGQGDVSIGGFIPDPSAVLDLQSITKGFLMPRLTSAQRDAIVNPSSGLIYYNTDLGAFQVNTGTESEPFWETILTNRPVQNDDWHLGGNVAPFSNIFGTLDETDIDVRTDDVTAMTISAADQSITISNSLTVNGHSSLGDGSGDNATVNVSGGQLTLLGLVGDPIPTTFATINGSNQVRQTSLEVLTNSNVGPALISNGGILELSPGNAVYGQGTENILPLWVNGAPTSELGNSILSQNGAATQATVSGSLDVTNDGSITGNLNVDGNTMLNGHNNLGDGSGDNTTVNVTGGEMTVTGVVSDPSPRTLVTINGSDQVRETPLESLTNTGVGPALINNDGVLELTSGNAVYGEGTENFLPLWVNGSPTSELSNSIVSQNPGGTIVTVGGSLDVDNNGSVTGDLGVDGNTALNGQVNLGDGSGDNVTINVSGGTLTATGLPASSTSDDLLVSNGGIVETRTIGSLNGEVGVVTDATLNGNGTTGTPLGINLSNSNTWTATQRISNGDFVLENTSNSAGRIQFAEPNGSGSNLTSFRAGPQTTDIDYILPLSTTPGSTLEEGLLQLDASTGQLSWVNPSVIGMNWSLTGNGGTTPGTHFLGTTDNAALHIRTNGADQLIVNVNGSIQRDAGGNARGAEGIDLQRTRTNSTEVASGDYSAIGGGRENTASDSNSTVGGGIRNVASSTSSSVLGGDSNIASGLASTVGGGSHNTVSGRYGGVPGGRGLTLSGNGSFGFLGGNDSGSGSGDNSMTVAEANTTLIGNTHIWVTNNDSTARQVRFYEANDSTGTFPAGGVFYTSFEAPALGDTIEYILPATKPTVGQFLFASSVSGDRVTLSWLGIFEETFKDAGEEGGSGKNLFNRGLSTQTASANLEKELWQKNRRIEELENKLQIVEQLQKQIERLEERLDSVEALPGGKSAPSLGR